MAKSAGKKPKPRYQARQCPKHGIIWVGVQDYTHCPVDVSEDETCGLTLSMRFISETEPQH